MLFANRGPACDYNIRILILRFSAQITKAPPNGPGPISGSLVRTGNHRDSFDLKPVQSVPLDHGSGPLGAFSFTDVSM